MIPAQNKCQLLVRITKHTQSALPDARKHAAHIFMDSDIRDSLYPKGHHTYGLHLTDNNPIHAIASLKTSPLWIPNFLEERMSLFQQGNLRVFTDTCNNQPDVCICGGMRYTQAIADIHALRRLTDHANVVILELDQEQPTPARGALQHIQRAIKNFPLALAGDIDPNAVKYLLPLLNYIVYAPTHTFNVATFESLAALCTAQHDQHYNHC